MYSFFSFFASSLARFKIDTRTRPEPRARAPRVCRGSSSGSRSLGAPTYFPDNGNDAPFIGCPVLARTDGLNEMFTRNSEGPELLGSR